MAEPRPCCSNWTAERHITIRESTAAERIDAGAFWATGTTMQAPTYVVVDADEPSRLLGAFGMVDGGETQAEAVFWAERMASKNGMHYIVPPGFEGVEGALPPERPRSVDATALVAFAEHLQAHVRDWGVITSSAVVACATRAGVEITRLHD